MNFLSDGKKDIGESVHKNVTLWCLQIMTTKTTTLTIHSNSLLHLHCFKWCDFYFIRHCRNVLGKCILCKHNNYYCQWLEIAIGLRKMTYQLNSSESCTGNLNHCDSIIEGYQYSMSKGIAFESLWAQNNSNWIISSF